MIDSPTIQPETHTTSHTDNVDNALHTDQDVDGSRARPSSVRSDPTQFGGLSSRATSNRPAQQGAIRRSGSLGQIPVNNAPLTIRNASPLSQTSTAPSVPGGLGVGIRSAHTPEGSPPLGSPLHEALQAAGLISAHGDIPPLELPPAMISHDAMRDFTEPLLSAPQLRDVHQLSGMIVPMLVGTEGGKTVSPELLARNFQALAEAMPGLAEMAEASGSTHAQVVQLPSDDESDGDAPVASTSQPTHQQAAASLHSVRTHGSQQTLSDLPGLHMVALSRQNARTGGELSVRSGEAESAHTDAIAQLAPLDTTSANGFDRFFKNAGVVVGHRLLTVAVATAIREAVGAGTEALLDKTNASDETKVALASTMLGVVIGANMMSMIYRMNTQTGTKWSHAGNAAQIASLVAGMTSALKAGTLKNLVPSLVKTGAYAGVRDMSTLMLTLSNNLGSNADPVATSAVNFALYSVNQFMVNNAQGFKGISGAGIYDGLHGNSSVPESERGKFKDEAAGKLTTYVLANTAGEALDAVVPALIQYRLQRNTFDGIGNLEFSIEPKMPTIEDFIDKIQGDVVPRLSLFDSFYSMSSAMNPSIGQAKFGDPGADYMQNAAGALLVAAMCIPYAMAGVEKARSAIGNLRGGDA